MQIADLVIRDATIHTMNGHRDVARALAVRGERIVAVSSVPDELDD
jgi:predicted amidohydrolase YtcJ